MYFKRCNNILLLGLVIIAYIPTVSATTQFTQKPPTTEQLLTLDKQTENLQPEHEFSSNTRQNNKNLIQSYYQNLHKRNEQLNGLTNEVIKLIAQDQFVQDQFARQSKQLVQEMLTLDNRLFDDLIAQQYQHLLELIKQVSKAFKGSSSRFTSFFKDETTKVSPNGKNLQGVISLKPTNVKLDNKKKQDIIKQTGTIDSERNPTQPNELKKTLIDLIDFRFEKLQNLIKQLKPVQNSSNINQPQSNDPMSLIMQANNKLKVLDFFINSQKDTLQNTINTIESSSEKDKKKDKKKKTIKTKDLLLCMQRHLETLRFISPVSNPPEKKEKTLLTLIKQHCDRLQVLIYPKKSDKKKKSFHQSTNKNIERAFKNIQEQYNKINKMDAPITSSIISNKKNQVHEKWKQLSNCNLGVFINDHKDKEEMQFFKTLFPLITTKNQPLYPFKEQNLLKLFKIKNNVSTSTSNEKRQEFIKLLKINLFIEMMGFIEFIQLYQLTTLIDQHLQKQVNTNQNPNAHHQLLKKKQKEAINLMEASKAVHTLWNKLQSTDISSKNEPRISITKMEMKLLTKTPETSPSPPEPIDLIPNYKTPSPSLSDNQIPHQLTTIILTQQIEPINPNLESPKNQPEFTLQNNVPSSHSIISNNTSFLQESSNNFGVQFVTWPDNNEYTSSPEQADNNHLIDITQIQPSKSLQDSSSDIFADKPKSNDDHHIFKYSSLGHQNLTSNESKQSINLSNRSLGSPSPITSLPQEKKERSISEQNTTTTDQGTPVDTTKKYMHQSKLSQISTQTTETVIVHSNNLPQKDTSHSPPEDPSHKSTLSIYSKRSEEFLTPQIMRNMSINRGDTPSPLTEKESETNLSNHIKTVHFNESQVSLGLGDTVPPGLDSIDKKKYEHETPMTTQIPNGLSPTNKPTNSTSGYMQISMPQKIMGGLGVCLLLCVLYRFRRDIPVIGHLLGVDIKQDQYTSAS